LKRREIVAGSISVVLAVVASTIFYLSTSPTVSERIGSSRVTVTVRTLFGTHPWIYLLLLVPPILAIIGLVASWRRARGLVFGAVCMLVLVIGVTWLDSGRMWFPSALALLVSGVWTHRTNNDGAEQIAPFNR
jgi:hypothetical protein